MPTVQSAYVNSQAFPLQIFRASQFASAISRDQRRACATAEAEAFSDQFGFHQPLRYVTNAVSRLANIAAAAVPILVWRHEQLFRIQ